MKVFILFILIILILWLFIFNNSASPLKEKFKNTNYILPKQIYCYWHDLSNNPVINAHLNTWKKHVPSDWKINIIDSKNLHNFVSKKFINKYIYLDAVRFSDFLRIELLVNNGGVWMDPGIFVTNGAFLDTFYNEMIIHKYDATLFEFVINTTMAHAPHLENWFIMAPKNSKLIKDLYTEFIKSENIGFLKYKRTVIIPSNINISRTLKYKDDTYLMQHAIFNYLFHTKPRNYYHVNIKDSYDGMFKIQSEHRWNHKNTIDFIINNKNWSKYYAVKLTSTSREFITDQNRNEYIKSIEQI
jgi:hypothetical protein